MTRPPLPLVVLGTPSVTNAPLTIHFLQTGGILKGYDIDNAHISITVHCDDQEDGTTSVHFKRILRHPLLSRTFHEERYEGRLTGKTITGYWGREEATWDLHVSHLSEENRLGSFKIEAKSIEFFLHRPTDEVFKTNRIMALWKFARDATLYTVRVKLCSRVILLDRRKQRKEFIAFYIRQMDDAFRFFDDDQPKLQHIACTLSLADVNFYSSIATSIRRRRVIFPLVVPYMTFFHH